MRTREQLPLEWATTQINLGAALGNLAKRYSERAHAAQDLQQAVEAFRNAQQVFTESAFPERWIDVTGNLATAYEAEADWADSLECYKQLLSHYPTNPYLQAKIKELSEKR